MKILHVIPSLAPQDGGTAATAANMCGELSRRGHQAAIYASGPRIGGLSEVTPGSRMNVGGASVSYFPGGKLNYYAISPRFAAALRSDIPQYRLVHIHSLYLLTSVFAAYYSRRFGIPYILQPHGALEPFIFRRHRARKRLHEILFERRDLRRAAAVIFATIEEMHLAKLSGLRFRGAVVPLGAEIEGVVTSADNAADLLWPQLEGKKVFLFLSRVNFTKGLDILAHAFGEIHRARPEAHLVIAGPDSDGYAAQVRGWLAAERALDATTFTGMVLGEKKAALLRRADLFVLPSYSENFGIAVVEAMGAGLPVVISNRVNIWREIEAARAGLVVEPDAAEVARAILALFDNLAAAKEMGERGRRLALEKFSWRAAVDQLVALYQEVISGRSPTLASAAAG